MTMSNLNRLDNVRESAYKLGQSTESALLSIKIMWIWLLDQFSAFDTIDHDMLLDSLRSWFGVSGVVPDWFKSYLSDHVQCL